MEKSAKQHKRFLLVIHYGFFILLTGLLITIIVIQMQNNRAQQERITALEDTMRKEFVRQTVLLLEAEHKEAESIAVTDDVYSELLSAQQKWTTESLYTEPALIEKERETLEFTAAKHDGISQGVR